MFRFDRWWSGETQIPLFLLSQIGATEGVSRSLFRLRWGAALATFIEIIGYFLVTLGLFPGHSASWFLLGVLFKIGGDLVGSFLQNRSGILLSQEFRTFLSLLTRHSQEIVGLLSKGGIAQEEIRALDSLPSEIYQTELHCYRRSSLLTFGAPFACGLALMVGQEVVFGVLVLFLGLLSVPIAGRYFKQRAYRNEEQSRIGRSARLPSYIGRTLHRHLVLTLQVNSLSQMPLLLFAIRFIANGVGQLLATFYALTQGLVGFTGALAFQRSRTAAIRTAKKVSHLVESVVSSSLIVTDPSWTAHVKSWRDTPLPKTGLKHGIILVNFCPILRVNEERTKLDCSPLSCSIQSGEACLIQAPSGRGKSTLIMALIHLMDHEGDLYFVKEGRVKNSHDFDREHLQQRMLFRREGDLGDELRIVDLFQKILEKRLSCYREELISLYGGELVELAWRAEDALVEHAIDEMEKGSSPIFPIEMFSALKAMRSTRSRLVSELLQLGQGNLATQRMVPERTFATLSSGEKKRLMTLIVWQEAALFYPSLVILDEPLAHLDEASIEDQLKVIQEIRRLPNPPALLIISHTRVDLLTSALEIRQSLIQV